jgi:hypothetical protein
MRFGIDYEDFLLSGCDTVQFGTYLNSFGRAEDSYHRKCPFIELRYSIHFSPISLFLSYSELAQYHVSLSTFFVDPSCIALKVEEVNPKR